MIQLIQPNLNTVGNIGWCLSFAEDAFGTPHLYATATDGWNATKFKRTDSLPNAYVPVWFSYYEGGINYGHVAVYSPDGRVLSSPYKKNNSQQWFSSIQECERVLNCKYLGWSEDIANVRIVKEGEQMDKVTTHTSRILSHGIIARNGVAGRSYSLDGAAGDPWVGADLTNDLINDIFSSPEGVQWRDSEDDNSVRGINRRLAEVNGLKLQVADFSTERESYKKQLDELNKVTKIKENEILRLQKALDSVSVSVDPDSVTITKNSLWEWFKKIFKKG